MGNENTQPVKYSKEQLNNNHPWHQKSWIVRQEDRSYIQSSYPIEEKHYEQWRNNVKNITLMPNSAFLYLPTDMGYVPNEELNAKDGYVVANYPHYPILLSNQINRRKPEKAYFKEKQLYYLLYALVAAKVDANNRAEVLGDIKPENVFINSDEKIKVGCLLSFPYEKSNYAKFTDKLKPSHNILLAPEDLLFASQHELDNKKNINSETFAIGATVLSAGILDDLADIYDYPNQAFRSDEHTRKTTEWLDHPSYSEIFKSIILSMLNPQPEKRISLFELWTFLSKYKSSILAKEQFIVNNPPTQLETGVSIIRSKIK